MWPDDNLGLFFSVLVAGGGLFVYSGAPAAGNLIASIAAAAGTDPYGNTFEGGITDYSPGSVFTQLVNGGANFGSLSALTRVTVPGQVILGDAGGPTVAPVLIVKSPQTAENTQSQILLAGTSQDNTTAGARITAQPVGPGIVASPFFSILGSLAVTPPGNPTSTSLDVEGATNGAGQLAFIKNSPIVNGDHTLTVNQSGTGADNTVAGNFTSNSDLSSTVYINGQATQRGVLKITHLGQASGSDTGASGLSIDLQTTIGGATGTAAQGIFLTSTTDSIPGGNAITIRYNSQDWFVVKGNVGAGNGIVGIGVATAHVPAGMLEIAQKDTTTFGLAMTAIAMGTDMINLKDSGGSQRFQVSNGGNLVARANAFFTSPVMFGTTSSDAGGGGGGVLCICNNTDPATNPASGHILLYCDVNGNLKARTQAGNVRIVAAV